MKTKPPATGGSSAVPNDQPTYRSNPEVDAKIDAYIKANPRFWTYVQGMPRERLERTIALSELREVERQQRVRDGVLKKIQADPQLKQAYDLIVKNVPEDQREAVMTQIARQTQRTVVRTQQGQAQSQGMGV